MGSKGGGTQGYRYYMSLLSGLCRGPVDQLVEIKIGDKTAWLGQAEGNSLQSINQPNLFGGDDKEGGVQGPFAVYMGDENQVLPGAQGSLPDVRGSIGGLVSQMRGVTTVWFDGMVAAMNPYLKTWKFRVRRSKMGWFGGAAWYPSKATVYLGSDNLVVTTNRPDGLPVTLDEANSSFTITFNRNGLEGDEVAINGQTITFVKDQDDDDLAEGEFDPDKDIARTVRKLASYINARSTKYKATASYNANSVTIAPEQSSSKINAMNASHIVYECYTNPLWGRGWTPSRLDENSFVYAANTLCNEGFGLALIWYRKEDIDVFIQKVCDLVGGLTYTDRETGKVVFKLIRADYDLDDVPLYTPETGLLDITDDDSASSDNSYNEIIGTSTDPVTGLDFQVRAQNLAGFQSQGAVSSMDRDYKGIPTKALLSRVVLRDLRAMASGLKKYNVTLDRRAWRVTPGSVIRISHPGRGLQNVVLRVGEIDDGNMVNGAIKIKAAIDVFGLPSTTYVETVDSGWVAPSKVAVPAPDERLIEAGYRDVYRALGAGDAQALDPTSAYVGQLAVAPNATSLEYDLYTKAEGEAEYVDRGRGPFTGNAKLTAAITPLQTEIGVKSMVSFDAGNVGQVLLVNDELVRLDALDVNAGTATITRGVADTIPQNHAAGATLWTVDDDLIGDGQAWAIGETVYSKVLTRTSSDLLDATLADEQEIMLVGRQALPYPPGDVRIGDVSIFAAPGEQPEPVLTWASRNRLTQADHIVGHTEPSVAGEDGQVYTIRIYAADGETLLRTVDDIADTTWTYTAAMQAEDEPASTVIAELESKRGELVSWQRYRFPIVLNGGWGYGWGLNWGAPA